MSRMYLALLDSQTPDKSGWPSGDRGAGAERLGLPSGPFGIPWVGDFHPLAIDRRTNQYQHGYRKRNSEYTSARFSRVFILTSQFRAIVIHASRKAKKGNQRLMRFL